MLLRIWQAIVDVSCGALLFQRNVSIQTSNRGAYRHCAQRDPSAPLSHALRKLIFYAQL